MKTVLHVTICALTLISLGASIGQASDVNTPNKNPLCEHFREYAVTRKHYTNKDAEDRYRRDCMKDELQEAQNRVSDLGRDMNRPPEHLTDDARDALKADYYSALNDRQEAFDHKYPVNFSANIEGVTYNSRGEWIVANFNPPLNPDVLMTISYDRQLVEVQQAQLITKKGHTLDFSNTQYLDWISHIDAATGPVVQLRFRAKSIDKAYSSWRSVSVKGHANYNVYVKMGRANRK